MASTDYTAAELMTPSDVAPVVATFGVINGDELVTGSDVAPTQSSINAIPAQDLVTVRPILYRLRGYYVGGTTYEFWTGVSIDSPNPSGNPLINKVVDSVLS